MRNIKNFAAMMLLAAMMVGVSASAASASGIIIRENNGIVMSDEAHAGATDDQVGDGAEDGSIYLSTVSAISTMLGLM